MPRRFIAPKLSSEGGIPLGVCDGNQVGPLAAFAVHHTVFRSRLGKPLAPLRLYYEVADFFLPAAGSGCRLLQTNLPARLQLTTTSDTAGPRTICCTFPAN